MTVNWSAPASGAPPTGYLVKRYDNSGTLQAIGAACSGTIATTSCTEAAVPAGTWRYRVTPANANWRGAESAASAAVTVSAPALSLSPASVTALPAALSGQITNFITGQTVTFRLDNPTSGTLLTGSIAPSPVPASGTANVSVTLPSGTAAGAHTVYAIGSLGDSASAPVTVLVPQTLVTSAWDLDDASAGGAEVNASDPVAFAADGRTRDDDGAEHRVRHHPLPAVRPGGGAAEQRDPVERPASTSASRPPRDQHDVLLLRRPPGLDQRGDRHPRQRRRAPSAASPATTPDELLDRRSPR